MIPAERVCAVLRPWLGSFFLRTHSSLCRQLCDRLNRFTLWQDDVQQLSDALRNELFEAVYAYTQGTCVLGMDSGRRVRIPREAYADMADELLYLVYCQMPVSEANWRRIRAFVLHNDSLSALRVMLEAFTAWLQPEDLAAFGDVIRKNYPPFRWQSWLDGVLSAPGADAPSARDGHS